MISQERYNNICVLGRMQFKGEKFRKTLARWGKKFSWEMLFIVAPKKNISSEFLKGKEILQYQNIMFTTNDII